MKICYRPKKFKESSLAVIAQALEIVEDYERQGFNLTLRQLFYQFVQRGLLPNTERSYKNLGNTISDARMAGLISWTSIEDRTRSIHRNTHWKSPEDILEAVRSSYRIDMWTNQPLRPLVWIEKDALLDLISRPCSELDVAYASCRGYTSQSMLWRAAQDLVDMESEGQRPLVIYLGDHDPSGLDMARDIEDRLGLFGVMNNQVRRIALTMEQIEEMQPPPNPAKVTDARYHTYMMQHGNESWELDALEPSYLVNIIREAILDVRDEDALAERRKDLEHDHDILDRAIDVAMQVDEEED
jgi:hypothetical protein